MRTSTLAIRAAEQHDPPGWRAATVRVLVNAVLVLLAYEVVSLSAAAGDVVVQGWTPPMPPAPFLLVAAAFYLARWVFVLPGVLPVLVGIEYVARRTSHARLVTAAVAFAPVVLWELLSPGDVPFGVILGLTAVVFAAVARLPARTQECATDHRGTPEPFGPAAAPR